MTIQIQKINGRAVRRDVWVLMAPDNEHWTEEDAREAISRNAENFSIKVIETGQTRDTGHGQERLFIIEGREKDLDNFETALDEELY